MWVVWRYEHAWCGGVNVGGMGGVSMGGVSMGGVSMGGVDMHVGGAAV